MLHTGLKTRIAITVILFLQCFEVLAQWGAPYANSWIPYDKPYVKIAIAQKGIYKIPFTSLPAGFSTTAPEKLQLWHRGQQVAILSTSKSEITFYAVPNDGQTDSLLYRPMSSRKNPFFSFYSDQSAYFLINGDAAGLRAETQSVATNPATPLFTEATAIAPNVFLQEYSLSTEFPIRPSFFNSFFELAASKTAKVQLGKKQVPYAFTLSKLGKSGADKAILKLLVHGRSNNTRNIEIYVGKNEQSLRLVQTVSNAGFAGVETSFELKGEDVGTDGKGVLSFKSVSQDALDRFSPAYFTISYAQDLDMAGLKTLQFTVPATTSKTSRIGLKNGPAGAQILDITNEDRPVIYPGSLSDFTFNRQAGKAANLLVTSEVATVAAANMSSGKFTKLDLAAANYIIITSENLFEGAKLYADYRASTAGGGYKTLVVGIKDIYNQFNYGEPSPVGIRKFVAFMLTQGNRDKQILLIGKSITHNERMKRELPDEVPTIGYPGSDVLLVEGLGGTPANIPSVPIGRIPAVTNDNIRDYLQKVKEYESNAFGELGWRKKVLHLNGGKTTSEITQLKSMLKNLVPVVTDGQLGGQVTAFVKQQGIIEPEKVNITPEVNAGVGLITYFGHGSTTITDLDMGYATDEVRAYSNALRYPMMYFNGCGVGNIFSGRFNPAANTSDRYSLSMDWLLAARRGAIAIMANSFESFVSPSEDYLSQLYQEMFANPDMVNQTIGKIQLAVSQKIASTDKGAYAIANIHQSLLQGDPALRLITVDKPDYAVDPDEGISIHSELGDKTIGNSANLRLRTVLSNKGRFQKGGKVPVEISYRYKEGNISKTETVQAFAYSDTLEVTFVNDKILQSVQVVIDPKITLSEMTRKNNIAELLIDWDRAKDEKAYPATALKDVVPPVLSVNFNGRQLENNEVIRPNPRITVDLEDDRLVVADTSLIEVFLKACQDESCKFKKINISDPNVTIDSVTSHSIRLSYASTGLSTGKYELLVNGRDMASNATVQPYQLFFEVSEGNTTGVEVVASPNPATTYLRFEAAMGSYGVERASIKSLLFDKNGNQIFEKVMDTDVTEKFTWYMQVESLTSGLYVYKIKITPKNASGTEFEKTGRIVIIR
ncbi:C25 family cysteine peptidase [Dyadobacter sp. 22481]|uniref:putative type IX secretion system sortase PorU2 n=1 Tax=Dyadobacter sp. 22481 TaxID=3453926 RepID=UPI003F850F33